MAIAKIYDVLTKIFAMKENMRPRYDKHSDKIFTRHTFIRTRKPNDISEAERQATFYEIRIY